MSVVKLKAKVITLTNHNRNKTQNEPIKKQRGTIKTHEECEQETIGFGFTSDWLRKWREFF